MVAQYHAETNGTETNITPPALFAHLPDGEWTPETVTTSIANRPTPSSKSPIPFLHTISRLKTTKREGWRRFGVPNGESIADHMYRMGIITMLAPASLRARLDLSRCTHMALVHDMAESLVGDITPVDGVNKKEKSRREASTMDYLCSGLLGKFDNGLAGDEIKALWREYEDAQTPESIFVHDVDKLELLLQMVEYERAAGGRRDLSEFAYVAQHVATPELKVWCQELLDEQAAFWKEQGVQGLVKTKSPEEAVALRKQQDEYYSHLSATSTHNH